MMDLFACYYIERHGNDEAEKGETRKRGRGRFLTPAREAREARQRRPAEAPLSKKAAAQAAEQTSQVSSSLQ